MERDDILIIITVNFLCECDALLFISSILTSHAVAFTTNKMTTTTNKANQIFISEKWSMANINMMNNNI